MKSIEYLPAATKSQWLTKLLRLVGVALLLLVLILAISAIIRAVVFYSLYTWLLRQVVEATGQDLWISRAITLGLFAILWLIGWSFFLLPWIGSARRRATILIAVTVLALAGMGFATRNVYFSRADGRALKYYSRLPDGRIEMFDMPGFHPRYGTRLQPVTPETMAQYEMQAGPLPRGRYVFPEPRPRGAIHGFRFTLLEIDLTADKMLAHIRVENLLATDSEAPESPMAFGFGIITAGSKALTAVAYRITDGALTYRNDGGIVFPAVGQRGRFVVEFQPHRNLHTFSMTINDQSLFGSISLPHAKFLSF
jgi:hypothetical protein